MSQIALCWQTSPGIQRATVDVAASASAIAL